MSLLHAGPYAAFIWPAYGLTAAVLVWMVADTLIRARAWRARAESRGAEGGRKDRAEP